MTAHQADTIRVPTSCLLHPVAFALLNMAPHWPLGAKMGQRGAKNGPTRPDVVPNSNPPPVVDTHRAQYTVHSL